MLVSKIGHRLSGDSYRLIAYSGFGKPWLISKRDLASSDSESRDCGLHFRKAQNITLHIETSWRLAAPGLPAKSSALVVLFAILSDRLGVQVAGIIVRRIIFRGFYAA